MLANGLSLARILLAPAVAFSLYRDGQSTGTLTLALMLTGGATDLLDGWVARRLGQTSDLGRVLDPLADKIFIGCICICLVLLQGFPLWLVALQGIRDLAIVGVGVYLVRSRQFVRQDRDVGDGADDSGSRAQYRSDMVASGPRADGLADHRLRQ